MNGEQVGINTVDSQKVREHIERNFREENDKVQQAVIENLSKISNRYGKLDLTAMFEAFRKEHRTIQQRMGGNLFSLIKEVARIYNDPMLRGRCFDARNECFGERCSMINRAMHDIVGHSNWDVLPFI